MIIQKWLPLVFQCCHWCTTKTKDPQTPSWLGHSFWQQLRQLHQASCLWCCSCSRDHLIRVLNGIFQSVNIDQKLHEDGNPVSIASHTRTGYGINQLRITHELVNSGVVNHWSSQRITICYMELILNLVHHSVPKIPWRTLHLFSSVPRLSSHLDNLPRLHPLSSSEGSFCHPSKYTNIIDVLKLKNMNVNVF